MNDKDSVRAGSQALSWLLRHGAQEAGLAMDAAGWAEVEDVLQLTDLDRPTLEAIVATNDKGRLQLSEGRVRACQGHSREGLPVTLEALEASWQPVSDPATVWHGTGLAALDGIFARGIEPSARTHVHLAEGLDSVVGKRARVQVMLAVSVARLEEAGLGVWRAPNGVLLARRVPASAIEGARAMSRKASARAREGAGPFPWL